MTSYAADRANSSTPNEVGLISDARQGDQDAFNTLVLRYQDRIYNLAARILGDDDLAQDITQNTFLTAYLNLSRFRNGSFRSWLYRIATNACYDEFRRHKRYPVQSLEAENIEESRLSPFSDVTAASVLPEIEHDRRELEQMIQNALDKLDPDQRTVVVLVDQQELDYQEAAQVLGVPIGTIKSRLARARLRLRQLLYTDTGDTISVRYSPNNMYVE